MNHEKDAGIRRLLEAIDKSGLAYAEIARRAGICPTNLQNYRQGVRPSMDKLGALCRVLGVSADWVLGLEGKPQNEEEETVFDEAIEAFGAAKQAVKAVEELSELQKELCKWLIGESRRESLSEEMADVGIMLDQLGRIFRNGDQVSLWRERKIRRLKEKVRAKRKGAE